MITPAMQARLDAAETIAPIAKEGPRPLYRDLPPPGVFPMDALGLVLGNAAKAIAAVIQCPDEAAANSVLAVASLAAQGRANVILPIGQGKPSPLSLYLLTVLDSGERKSSADSMALKPVRDFERELAEAEAGQRQAYAVKLAAHDAKTKHWRPPCMTLAPPPCRRCYRCWPRPAIRPWKAYFASISKAGHRWRCCAMMLPAS